MLLAYLVLVFVELCAACDMTKSAQTKSRVTLPRASRPSLPPWGSAEALLGEIFPDLVDVWLFPTAIQFQSAASKLCGQYCVVLCMLNSRKVDLHSLLSSEDSGLNDSIVRQIVLCTHTVVFGRPYYRSCLWYSVSSVVCRLSVCL